MTLSDEDLNELVEDGCLHISTSEKQSLAAELQRYRTEVPSLREELKEWKEDAERLAKCLHPEVPIINTGIDNMVFELCEKFGYGAVMCSASRLWHEMNDSCKNGAFTVSSCYVIVENALEAHRLLVEKEGKK